MTVYVTVALSDDAAEALERLAAASMGITREALAEEAIEAFVKNREEARRRVAESAFLIAGRRRAG